MPNPEPTGGEPLTLEQIREEIKRSIAVVTGESTWRVLAQKWADALAHVSVGAAPSGVALLPGTETTNDAQP